MNFCGHTSYDSLDFLGWCSCISLHTLGNRFATLPSSSGTQWSTSWYPVFSQEIAWTARLWLLNCESQDCGLPGKRTVLQPTDDNSGDSQNSPVARPRPALQILPARISHLAISGRFQTNHDVAQVVVPDCLYAADCFLSSAQAGERMSANAQND
jgi:hypothetical protein